MNKNIVGANALTEREIIHIPASEEVSGNIKVAAYARVSSDSDAQLNSFESQVKYYTDLIEQNEKYDLADIYADEGISGVKTENRYEFLRMMEDARNGKIDLIITKSLSRFSRNILDGIMAVRELKSIGVTVVFEKEGIDTRKITSENLLSIYALLSQHESINISQNCKKGNRARMQMGEYVISHPPYGYKLVGGKLSICEAEAEIVKRIFKEYLNGYGYLNIANRLNDDAISRGENDTKWNKKTIQYILKNEKYIGDMLLQKSYREDIVPYKKRKNNGELAQYYITNSHEAIIDRIVFEIAKSITENQQKKVKAETGTTNHILSKKIKCGVCGKSYIKKIVRGKAYWVCLEKDLRKENCASERVSENDIHNSFINMYNKLQENKSVFLNTMINQLEKLENIKYKDSAEIKRINTEIVELSEQNHMMSGLMADGILDSALFLSSNNEINKKIANLKKEKSIILKNRNSNKFIDKTEELLDILEENDGFLIDMDNEIFDEIVSKVSLKNNKIVNFHLINDLVLSERAEDD